MPQYKLHYFDTPTRGRAEFARLILVQAGVQFEDIRFKHSEWPTIKPSKERLRFILMFLDIYT